MENHEAEKLYGVASSSSTQHPQFASATEKPTLNMETMEDYQKRRRMLFNRESARQSRIRKKQQMEALQCRVNELQAMNDQLSRKIISLLECNQQLLQQNLQLKEKVSSLQEALSNLLIPCGSIAEPSQA